MAEPSYTKLTSAHFYAWSLGLKTGQYYLRSRPARDAIKFTLDVESVKRSSGSALFDHMNTKNLTQAEMDKQRRKKRKINEISNKASIESFGGGTLSKNEGSDKENQK